MNCLFCKSELENEYTNYIADLGEKIKIRRKELELTMLQVAKKVGVSEATVSRWESGDIANMRRDKIVSLANALQVAPSFIMDETTSKYNDISSLAKYGIRPIKTKKFPMLGEIACGKPIYCNEDYETYIEASEDINADFCLTAKGDSMINARIFDGDIVFIREQPTVENGEIAAIVIDDSATLKRVYLKSDKIILRPENPIYDDIIYEKEDMNMVRILGKAVAFQSAVR